MAEIQQILTQRRFNDHPCMQIVYEWEDVLSRELGICLADDFHSSFLPIKAFRRLFPAVARMTKPNAVTFVFELSAWRDFGNDKASILPCIIDFFVRDEHELARLYRRYQRSPIVLVSSLEAFDFLKARHCPLNICHWGLSIPDKWIPKKDDWESKSYDVALMGRENPVLKEYLARYVREHPAVRCIRRVGERGSFVYRSDRDGMEFPGNSREDYMRVMRMARVGLYATPGMDNARPTACGFNQVTPRFLELLSAGCRVVARYPDNADTRYYQLSEIAPSIGDYAQFSAQMDVALSRPLDFQTTVEYLRRHSTSARARELRGILSHA